MATPDNAKIIVAFESKFPDVAKVGWSKDEDEIWYAHFQKDKKTVVASYTFKGQWLETETDIKKNEIPKEILEAVTKDFGQYRMDQIILAESATGQLYEFTLTLGKDTVNIVINPTGEVVKN